MRKNYKTSKHPKQYIYYKNIQKKKTFKNYVHIKK